MPKPISRLALIRKLKKLGFVGPFSAARHQYMELGKHKIFVPNPHKKDIGVPLVKKIMQQVDIKQKEWENL